MQIILTENLQMKPNTPRVTAKLYAVNVNLHSKLKDSCIKDIEGKKLGT